MATPLQGTSVVVAIDVGTSGTGYTIAFRPAGGVDDVSKVDIIPRVPGLKQAATTKNLTAVLLRAEDEAVVAVGRAAREQFINAAETGRPKDFLYFERFKMGLASGARGGRKISAMTVKALGANVDKPLLLPFKALLSYIREEALAAIRSSVGSVNEREVGWVLTVPAIWDDEAKAFMRKAAHAAGMIPDEGSNRLLLALEPEGATVASFVAAPPPLQQRFAPGKRSIIIDAGGGTVDITVSEFESTKPLRLKELLPASGGPWGGTAVDALLVDFVKQLFGASIARHVDGPALAALRDKWEDAKVNFKSAVDPSGGAGGGAAGGGGVMPSEDLESSYKIDMGFTLDNFPEEVDGLAALKDGVRRYNDGKPPSEQVQLSKLRRLTLPASVVHRVAMEPVVQQTVRHVRGLLEQPSASGVSLVLLAGGFAESSYLQHRIRETFETASRSVVVAPQPGFAINKGAAYIGLNPGSTAVAAGGAAGVLSSGFIASRVVRYSYGISTTNKFDVRVHHPATKCDHADGPISQNLLRRAVNRGTSVRTSETMRVGSFCPLDNDQREITLQVYRTEHLLPDPDYDEGEKQWYILHDSSWAWKGVLGVPPSAKVGEIEITVADAGSSAKRTDRSVTVELLFGQSEITVKVTADLTNEVKYLTLHYE